jgi:hypothetical protein
MTQAREQMTTEATTKGKALLKEAAKPTTKD